MVDSSSKPVCAVVGVGPGNGAAFVRRFANEGYRVAMIARSPDIMAKLQAEIPTARTYQYDVGIESDAATCFASIERDIGPVDTLIYNAGKGVWGTAEEVAPDAFEVAWRTNTFGAYLTTRAVLPSMRARGCGNIILIGATASRRGGARAAAFASAKAAQRSLAESLARSCGPAGIHVALIIVDGIVDEPFMRQRFKDKPDEFFVKPDDIADTAVMLTRQKRSAWSFEVEARPFGESW